MFKAIKTFITTYIVNPIKSAYKSVVSFFSNEETSDAVSVSETPVEVTAQEAAPVVAKEVAPVVEQTIEVELTQEMKDDIEATNSEVLEVVGLSRLDITSMVMSDVDNYGMEALEYYAIILNQEEMLKANFELGAKDLTCARDILLGAWDAQEAAKA